MKLCTPNERRLTPAARKPAKRPASAVTGLASSVISQSAVSGKTALTVSRIWATCSGSSSDGVPPPKYTVRAAWKPLAAPSRAITRHNASTYAGMSDCMPEYVLKSQYGHRTRQKGMCK